MATDYPRDEAVKVTVTPAEAETFSLRFRQPSCSVATTVKGNGEVCTMRGKKLRPGDRVTCMGQTYCVTGA